MHADTCNHRKLKSPLLQTNRWILYSRDEELLTRTCSDEIFRQKLKGTFILTLDDPCEVKIQDITLKMQKMETESVSYTKLPLMNLPLLYSPEKEIISKPEPVNLEGIDLTDLKLLSLALKKSESENSENLCESSVIEVNRISLWTLLVYLFIIVFLCVIVYKYKSKLFKKCKVQSSLPKDSKENFDFKEGGVMSVNSPGNNVAHSIQPHQHSIF
jgi:hypothetical protein